MDETLLWKNREGAPLVYILPGGTGSHRPASRGSDTIAAYFWSRGFSSYIGDTGGQDGRPGMFSLANCLSETRNTHQYLMQALTPSSVVYFASCSGGTVAAWMAAEDPLASAALLWEAPGYLRPESTAAFVERAASRGMQLSPQFGEEIFHLESAIPRLRLPIMFGYGHCRRGEAFTQNDLQRIRTAFSGYPQPFEEIHIPDADHSLTRGTNPELLHEVTARFYDFAVAHLPAKAASAVKV